MKFSVSLSCDSLWSVDLFGSESPSLCYPDVDIHFSRLSFGFLIIFCQFVTLVVVCIQAGKCKCGCSRCSVHRSSSLKRRFYVFNMNRAKLYFQQNCSRTSVCVWCSGRGWAKKPSEYERKYFRLNNKESMISIFSCGSVQRFYISGFHELFINILKTTFYLKISFRVTLMVQCLL